MAYSDYNNFLSIFRPRFFIFVQRFVKADRNTAAPINRFLEAASVSSYPLISALYMWQNIVETIENIEAFQQSLQILTLVVKRAHKRTASKVEYKQKNTGSEVILVREAKAIKTSFSIFGKALPKRY